MQVNILLLTIDRYEITKECVGEALSNAGYPFGLCVTDNGSTDERTRQLIDSWSPVYFKVNNFNAGTAQALNEMIARNDADLWVFIGNDIRLPQDWLKKMVEVIQLDNIGVVGINWRPINYTTKEINGVKVWETDRVFGTMGINKSLREQLGKFCEDYGVYGLWDGEYSLRSELAGRNNYYVYGIKSVHEGSDHNEQSDYRKMKTDSIELHKEKFKENVRKYHATKEIYI